MLRPADLRPPPQVCAPAPPSPQRPPGASFPAPVTDLERAAVTAFLSWLHALADHDAALMAQNTASARWCAAHN